MKYSVDEKNLRIATKVSADYSYSTIIGNTPLPLNKIISWNIKILKSRNNNGNGIWIGVAPFDINQNYNYIYMNCGWYFSCYHSKLYSGPPHNYKWKGYGPVKGYGKYVCIDDSVGVVIDTTKGDLSFILNGINYSVAYKRIPLDKPLVPCVNLYYKGGSVELII